MLEKPARTRFAPSPTGRMHLGIARTALYAYLQARRTSGTFILRIEDTDQKRFVPGAEQEIIEGLRWLGIHHDEGPDVGGPSGPYRQTERREIYSQHAWELVDKGFAFPCFCTPERLEKVRQEQIKNKQNPRYDGLCRSLELEAARQRVAAGENYVIRFKMPKGGTTTAVDLLRGPITTDNSAMDELGPSQIGRPAHLPPGRDGGRSFDEYHSRFPRCRVAFHLSPPCQYRARFRLGGADLGASLGLPQAFREGEDVQAGRRRSHQGRPLDLCY